MSVFTRAFRFLLPTAILSCFLGKARMPTSPEHSDSFESDFTCHPDGDTPTSPAIVRTCAAASLPLFSTGYCTLPSIGIVAPPFVDLRFRPARHARADAYL